jgi:nitrogen fixation protein FixH
MTGRDGAPVTGLDVVAVVGRPASDSVDVRLQLTEAAEGYAAPLDLAPGQWQVIITGTDAGGGSFEAAAGFFIKDPG